MKALKYFLSAVILIATIWSCSDEEFGSVDFVSTATAPGNVAAFFNVTQDNTGTVTITPNGDGAVSYEVYFGDNTAEPAKVVQGKSVTHVYAEGNYQVKIIATNITGLKTESVMPLVVSFKAPENLDVVITNDLAVSRKVNVTASADFAILFDVYFGEPGNDTPVSANNGGIASYVYAEAGTYTIRVVSKSAAIETTEYTQEFEAKTIQQPLASAPKQPNRNEADYISIYSDKYTNVAGTNFNPDWGQSGQGSSYAEFDLDGDKMLQYIKLSYQGIGIGETIDVSGMEYLHMDVWTADVDKIETSLINGVDGNSTEKPVWSTLTADKWTSINIPISEFTDQGLSVDQIFQLKFVGDGWAAGTVFIDNIYFYKMSEEPFDGGLVINGDFESGAEPWTIGVGTDPVPVVTDGGNTYYSVNVATAGQPYEVNASQKLEIIEGETYTLSFDAWSDTDRPILPGIGLSADPWTNVTEVVNITTTKQTYTVTLIANAGASDARVFFDLGAAVGSVNIDNVSLILGDGSFDDGLLTNGDFESGAEPWTIGVGTDPVPVVTDGGNTYYSVNVATAGQPYEVNASQKLEIIEGETYTLSFNAWSDTDRPILPGIGLSADPWTNVTEEVNITTTKQTYSVTLIANAGASDARVFFDLGAAVGSVNIDNVSLFIVN
jgi:hypothetical protein